MAGERSVKIRFTGDVKQLVGASSLGEQALKRFQDQAEKVRGVAAKLAGATKALIAPNAAPALAAVATAGVGAAAALGAAGAAVGVFGGVLKSAQGEISESATKVETLRDKMDLYTAQAELMRKAGEDNTAMLKRAADAQREIQATLALLPPEQRKATESFMQMKSDVQDFVDANKPATYGILQRGYALVGKAVGELQPLFDIGRAAADKALGALERFAAGGGIERLVAFLSANAGPALDNIGRIAKNVGTFLGALFQGTVADGQGLLKFLADASDRLAAFSTNGGLQRFLDSVSEQGPGAGQALVQIGQAAVTVAQAVGPLAPISLAIAQALAAIIAAVPPQVITALVAGWIAYTAAVGAYNVVMAVTAGATKAWAAAQTALNVVMSLNPIALVVIAVAALVAGIIILYKNSDTARKIIDGAFKGIAAAGKWLWENILKPYINFMIGYFKALGAAAMWLWKNGIVPAFNGVKSAVVALWNGYKTYINFVINIIRAIPVAVRMMRDDIVARFNSVVNFVKGLKSRISSATSGLWDGIKNSFRNALNYIVDKWNNLSFSLPSINTPFGKIGGTTLNTPNIPRLASGGWMQPGRTYLTGENGPELLTSSRRAYVNNANETRESLGLGSSVPVVQVFIGERELEQIVQAKLVRQNRQLRRAAGAVATAAGAR